MDFIKRYSLKDASIKRKLTVSYALMAVIPLLVLAYIIFKYAIPLYTPEFLQLFFMVVFAFWVSATGFWIIKQMFSPILKLSENTQRIAEGGDIGKMSLFGDDELTRLTQGVFSLKDMLQDYKTEIRNYSKKTSLLNDKLQRNLLTLNNLMNLTDLINSEVKFQTVTEYAACKILEEIEGGFCAIYIKSDRDSYALSSLINKDDWSFDVEKLQSLLPSIERRTENAGFIEVSAGLLKKEEGFHIEPVYCETSFGFHVIKRSSHVFGMIVVARPEEKGFLPEDIDMLKVFGKELLLVATLSSQKELDLESEKFSGLMEPVLLKDAIKQRIDEAVSSKKPCSVMSICFDGLMKGDLTEELVNGEIIDKTKKVLLEMLPAGGKATFYDKDRFLVFLPDKDKSSACSLAESLCSTVREMNLNVLPANELLTLSIGVSENLSDENEAEKLIEKAQLFNRVARSSGGDRVVSNC